MFQPISHCCSCLLWAEAGPESHLFHLSRSSNLERHQKAREERLWAWWVGKPASTFAGMRPHGHLGRRHSPQPKSAEVFAAFEIVRRENRVEQQLLFPQTLPFLFRSGFAVRHRAECQVWCSCLRELHKDSRLQGGTWIVPLHWLWGWRWAVGNMFPLKHIHRNTEL